MSATDIQRLTDAITQSQWEHVWLYLLVFGLVSGTCSFLGNYLAEKARNTATKEDIGVITRLIESVRTEYSAQIEGLKGSYQLRTAVLEKRLAVHQEAFSLWRRLILSAHTEDVEKIAHECEEWWEKHCIYLSPKARDDFMTAVPMAINHRALIKSGISGDRIERSWEAIRRAGDSIMNGASLPPLPSDAIPRPSGTQKSS